MTGHRGLPGILLLCGLGVAGPAAGQWAPAGPDDPARVTVEAGGVPAVVRLDIAPGWYLYGTEARRIGLPLGVELLRDGRAHPLAVIAFGDPDTLRVEGMSVAIHRGQVRLRLPEGAALRTGDRLRVRWAACRTDLCLPRESVVRVPPSGSGGSLTLHPRGGPDQR